MYRAELTLCELHRQLVPVMESLADAFEIVFVEDCGGDASWSVIEALAAGDSRVRGIRLNRNFGQHNAMLCGIRAAQYDIILTMDDDLQHPVPRSGSIARRTRRRHRRRLRRAGRTAARRPARHRPHT